MRSAHSRPVTVGLATGLFVISSGVTGAAMAATAPTASASPAASATAATAAAPSAASASSASSASSATSAPASASATQASSAPSAADPTTSTTPTPAPSSTSTGTGTSSGSGSGGTSVTATDPPTSTPTPTPTPSSSTTAPAGAASVTVTASTTTVQAGGTVLYRIAAWSNLAAAAAGTITVAVKSSGKSVATAFTAGDCTTTTATTCDLSVPNKRPSTPQVEMQVTVPKNAPAEKISYSATVSVADASTGKNVSRTASAATVTVAKAPAKSASPSPSASTSPSSGVGGNNSSAAGGSATISGLDGSLGDGSSIPVGPLPAVAGVSTTIPGGNASNLFPQISPSSTPSPAAGRPASGQGYRPVADSSRIPLALGSSEFGAQIVGLIVLLLGVAIAVTRLSIRRRSTPGTK